MIIGMRIFPSASFRRMKFFNEIILMYSIYAFLAYTPWVEDVEGKFLTGYISIFLIGLHLVINIALICAASAK